MLNMEIIAEFFKTKRDSRSYIFELVAYLYLKKLFGELEKEFIKGYGPFFKVKGKEIWLGILFWEKGNRFQSYIPQIEDKSSVRYYITNMPPTRFLFFLNRKEGEEVYYPLIIDSPIGLMFLYKVERRKDLLVPHFTSISKDEKFKEISRWPIEPPKEKEIEEGIKEIFELDPNAHGALFELIAFPFLKEIFPDITSPKMQSWTPRVDFIAKGGKAYIEVKYDFRIPLNQLKLVISNAEEFYVVTEKPYIRAEIKRGHSIRLIGKIERKFDSILGPIYLIRINLDSLRKEAPFIFLKELFPEIYFEDTSMIEVLFSEKFFTEDIIKEISKITGWEIEEIKEDLSEINKNLKRRAKSFLKRAKRTFYIAEKSAKKDKAKNLLRATFSFLCYFLAKHYLPFPQYLYLKLRERILEENNENLEGRYWLMGTYYALWVLFHYLDYDEEEKSEDIHLFSSILSPLWEIYKRRAKRFTKKEMKEIQSIENLLREMFRKLENK